MSTNTSGYNQDSVFYKYYDNSFFKKYFDLDDPEVIQFALTLLEKLYGKGILPNYVTRNQGELSPFADEDFISFFYTKAHFFSIIVKYARLYKDITLNDSLRKDFLDNVGIYYSYNQSQADLDYLFENYVAEIKKRGTDLIYKTKASGESIDGELLRLIDYLPIDEFIFALFASQDIGWCLGHSSPCFSGANHIVNLIKAYEYTEAIVDLTKYPLLNSGVISIDGDYMSMSLDSGESAGISDDSNETKRIIIDPNLDYEVSFKITCDTLGTMPLISFGVDVYDVNDNPITLQNRKTGDFVAGNYFKDSFSFNLTNTEYWVRGVILKRGTETDSEDSLNIGLGNNMVFSVNENYIIPKLVITATSNSTVVKIKDFKVRLGLLPFSLGQLGVKRPVVNFLKNNSGMPNYEVNTIIRNELLPYNVTYVPINL